MGTQKKIKVFFNYATGCEEGNTFIVPLNWWKGISATWKEQQVMLQKNNVVHNVTRNVCW